MKIVNLRILNYRGIKDIALTKLGSTTTLVGRNSAGKSAILEAVELVLSNIAVAGGNLSGVDEYFFRNRNIKKPAIFSVEVELDSEEMSSILPDKIRDMFEVEPEHEPNHVTITRVLDPSSQWKTQLISWSGFVLVTDDVTVSAVDLSTDFEKTASALVKADGGPVAVSDVSDQEINQALTQLIGAMQGRFALVSAIRDTITPVPGRSAVLGSEVQQNIQQLQQSPNKEDEELYLNLERLYRDLTGLRIDPIQGRVNVRRGSARIPMYLEGGGLQEACNLLYSLVSHQREGRIIGIEEPETHLHPSLQRRLHSIIQDVAKSSQLFIATHSPVFVGLAESTDTWIVQFVGREVKAKRLVEFSEALAELGVLPSDIYFANRVVFVEGPSDQVFLGAVATKLGVNLRDVVLLSMEGKANAVSVVKQWLEGTHGSVPLHVILDADAKRVSDKLLAAKLLPKKQIHVWSEGSIEDYYPPELIEQAIEAIDDEYGLGLNLEEINKTIESKGVKAAALSMGKKRPALEGRWNVVLARKVAELLPNYEGEVNPEIQRLVRSLVT